MGDNVNAGQATSGRFVWHELYTAKPDAAKAFYGELFGWKARDMDMGPGGSYTILSANGVDIGGLMKLDAKSTAGWLPYCTSEDVDASVDRAKKLGAAVEVRAMDIPTVGRFAVLRDGQGARVAPFKMEKEGPETERPGLGTFCWNELLTQDPKAALALYTSTFGWKTEEKDMGEMGTYTILKRGDRQSAGVMKAMDPKAPSMWLGYVAVDDVDASFDRAKRLKANPIVPPSDIPGIGRFAVVADPDGAVIALFKG